MTIRLTIFSVILFAVLLLGMHGAWAQDCCDGRVGDANNSGDDEPTIGDVSIMIDMLFVSMNPSLIACPAEADINQSGGVEPAVSDITIGDISLLIDYLYITGPSLGLADCIGTSSNCTQCHGGIDNQTGAPPLGLEGETLTIETAVGAHTSHLEGSFLSDGIGCVACHLVPEDISAEGHLDGDNIAEIIWGPQAGEQSSWDRNTETCGGTYCHGNFPGGFSGNTTVWTASGQAACGSCHDVGETPASLGGQHELHFNAGRDCVDCHAGTVDPALNTVGRELHVNGQADVLFASGVGAIYADGWCLNPACHSSAPWY